MYHIFLAVKPQPLVRMIQVFKLENVQLCNLSVTKVIVASFDMTSTDSPTLKSFHIQILEVVHFQFQKDFTFG